MSPSASLWSRVADLPLTVDGYALERHERDVSSAFAMEQIKYSTELPLDYMILEQPKSHED